MPKLTAPTLIELETKYAELIVRYETIIRYAERLCLFARTLPKQTNRDIAADELRASLMSDPALDCSVFTNISTGQLIVKFYMSFTPTLTLQLGFQGKKVDPTTMIVLKETIRGAKAQLKRLKRYSPTLFPQMLQDYKAILKQIKDYRCQYGELAFLYDFAYVD